MPTAPICGNSTCQDEGRWWRMNGLPDSDSEMSRYQDALRDPELWDIQAEQRTAWDSAVTLHEGPFGKPRTSLQLPRHDADGCVYLQNMCALLSSHSWWLCRMCSSLRGMKPLLSSTTTPKKTPLPQNTFIGTPLWSHFLMVA